MKTLYCDICQKQLENPIVSRTYFQVREFDVCEPCKDTIDAKLRPMVRNHFPFSTDWYEQQVVTLIERGISTGRA